MALRWLIALALVVACSKAETKHEDRAEPQTAPSKLALRVTIGGETTTLASEAFAATPKMPGTASSGEARDTWSLRELVHRSVGPTARVVKVTGDGSATIDAAAWSDETRTPVLHVTRRGTFKFRWTDKSGKWEEAVVKDVTAIEVER
jgi:hypothetical protein